VFINIYNLRENIINLNQFLPNQIKEDAMRCAKIFSVLFSALFLIFNPGKLVIKKDHNNIPTETILHDTLPDTISVWVFFKDKGPPCSKDGITCPDPTSLVSPRSIQRRLKIKPAKKVIDFTDLPVYKTYIDNVRLSVIEVKHQSRWFNGLSVVMLKSKIGEVQKLPFVKAVDFASRYITTQNRAKQRNFEYAPPFVIKAKDPDSLDYGFSFDQLNQINVPAVHRGNNYGQGVLIGVFDDGFNRLDHNALKNLNTVATYDFAEKKTSATPSDGSGGHGTMVLSVLAGFAPGKIIGPAFKASFVLARTEISSSETPLEEDNWIAAIEWADSIGVDIVSTSLGYYKFPPPFRSYTPSEMDGNNSLITRAADIAVSKGILVVVSVGNNGDFERDAFGNPVLDVNGEFVWVNYNTLGAPADGDSVLSVGAVDRDGKRTFFSSFGPTNANPPKIKPEVMALGQNVIVAWPLCTDCYNWADGTSFSAPLVAGAAALILSAHPNATPMQIIEALKMTASRARKPDRLNGWGVINTLEAIKYIRK
jgi:subtilisin family serine protease